MATAEQDYYELLGVGRDAITLGGEPFGGERVEPRRVGDPVDFDAADGAPVDLVFAMVVPEHFTQQHLQLLSELAESFAKPEFRNALRTARSADELRTTLLDGLPATAKQTA